MIKNLNHFTIATYDVAANIHFYQEIVGLTHGPHLEGAGDGAYFYLPASPDPVVHVIDMNEFRPNEQRSFEMHATAKPDERIKKHCTGTLDHIAFSVDMADFEETTSRLQQQGIAYQMGDDLMPRMKQLWMLDPNGIKVELNFS